MPVEEDRYAEMIRLQTQIAQEEESVVMVSLLMADLLRQGLMKDAIHYDQAG